MFKIPLNSSEHSFYLSSFQSGGISFLMLHKPTKPEACVTLRSQFGADFKMSEVLFAESAM
jgi:hypothetical protein